MQNRGTKELHRLVTWLSMITGRVPSRRSSKGDRSTKDRKMDQYRAFDVGNRLRIVAPGQEPLVDDRIDLVVVRGAFGSGEHETTFSCLEILAELDRLAGASVLDLGSGTGILAIAALKLGASAAVCLDIDAKAVLVADRNCRLNRLDNQILHVTGPLASLAAASFDLVLANLYADILLEVSADLVSRTQPGGRLLLSGVPWEQSFDVRQCYQQLGCRLLRTRMLEQYCTLLLSAPSIEQVNTLPGCAGDRVGDRVGE